MLVLLIALSSGAYLSRRFPMCFAATAENQFRARMVSTARRLIRLSEQGAAPLTSQVEVMYGLRCVWSQWLR